jgi:hypothetical protein
MNKRPALNAWRARSESCSEFTRFGSCNRSDSLIARGSQRLAARKELRDCCSARGEPWSAFVQLVPKTPVCEDAGDQGCRRTNRGSAAIPLDDLDHPAHRSDALPLLHSSDDFALSAVPQDARTAATSIALMLLAANISLPALVMGGQLGLARGLTGTITAAFVGGLLLAMLGGACAFVGARSRLTTYLLIVRTFGTRGGELINLLLTCSVVGWFAVVLVLFAQTMTRLAGGALSVWAISGTLLMVATMVVGFRALTWCCPPSSACCSGPFGRRYGFTERTSRHHRPFTKPLETSMLCRSSWAAGSWGR